MIWFIVGTVAPALLLAWVGGFLVRSAAPRIGLVDRPSARKVHTTPTPLGGGVAVWGAIVGSFALLQLAVSLWGSGALAGAWPERVGGPLFELFQRHEAGLREQLPRLWALLGGGTLLMLLGLADDRWGLPWQLRLGVQTLVAAAVVAAGYRLTLFVDLPWLTSALTVLWIVTLVNSFNMLDNMDGLSAGVGAIAAGILAAVMLMAPDPETAGPQLFVAGLLLVLVGALVGFLWHNRPPARLFMGDAGSYLVGYLLAIATIMATFAGSEYHRHSILAPLCVLAVPLYDTLTVVVIRLRSGHSPFHADRNHFSHRLTDLGMSKTQAVWTVYLATATCGLGALLLYQVDGTGAIVVLLLVAMVLSLVAVLETAGRRARNDDDPHR